MRRASCFALVLIAATLPAVAIEDAWTPYEGEQLAYILKDLFDDVKSAELNAAAQARYKLNEEGGKAFMRCIIGLSGHPDFTAARVREALDVCKKAAPQQVEMNRR